MAKLKVMRWSFGVIPNAVLNHKGLSFKAKGLYGYIQSKPDGWDFSSERIAEDSADGKESVRSGLKELEEAGFLVRSKTFTGYKSIDIEYVLHEIPVIVDKSETGNSTTENTSTNFTPTNNTTTKKPSYNKERESNKEVIKKEVSNKSPNGESEASEKTYWSESVNAIIRAYVEVNGFLEGSEKENRRYAHLLSKKLDAINGFDGRYYEIIRALITDPDKYNARYASSPKETYYNLAKLVASKKTVNKPIPSFNSFETDSGIPSFTNF